MQRKHFDCLSTNRCWECKQVIMMVELPPVPYEACDGCGEGQHWRHVRCPPPLPNDSVPGRTAAAAAAIHGDTSSVVFLKDWTAPVQPWFGGKALIEAFGEEYVLVEPPAAVVAPSPALKPAVEPVPELELSPITVEVKPKKSGEPSLPRKSRRRKKRKNW